MTSRISLVKISTHKLSQNLWLSASFFIVLLFTLPISTFVSAYQSNTNYNHFSLDFIQSPFLPIICIICAYLTPIVIFKYVNSKSELDFYHSLPIKRDKLFISYYTLGILIFLIPLFINLLASSLIANSFFPDYFDLELIKSIFKSFLNHSLAFIAIYSINVFSVLLTGNAFMSICVSTGFTFMFLTLDLLLQSFCTGFLDNYVSFSTDFVFFPNFSILPHSLFKYLDGYFDYFDFLDVSTIIFIAIYTCMAFFIYKKRPSENSSNAIAVDFFKPIIKSIAVFCSALIGGYIFCLSINIKSPIYILLFGIFTSFIVHCALEALYDSDFKSIFKNLKHFVILSAFFTICICTITFDLTGYDKKFVELDDIESIDLSCFVYFNNFDDLLFFDDEENIELIYNIANASRDVSSTSGSDYIFVNFNLKNGRSLSRKYVLNASDELLNLTQTYEFRSKLLNLNKLIANASNITNFSLYNKNIQPVSLDLIDEFIECLKYDVENNPNFVLDSVPATMVNLTYLPENSNIHNYFSILIPSTFENTLEFLNTDFSAKNNFSSDYLYVDFVDNYTSKILTYNPDFVHQDEVIYISRDEFDYILNHSFPSINMRVSSIQIYKLNPNIIMLSDNNYNFYYLDPSIYNEFLSILD